MSDKQKDYGLTLGRTPHPDATVVIGVDLQISPSQDADWSVFFALEVFEDEWRILDMERLQADENVQLHLLDEMAKRYNLKNFVFKPFIAKNDYPALVKESDVGIVCLSSKNRTPVVPGKILGYMAASIPVAAFLNKESDGHKIIEDAGCGYSAVSGDPGKAVEIIKRLYNEKERLQQYGENGNEYAKKHFSKSVCIDNLEKLF